MTGDHSAFTTIGHDYRGDLTRSVNVIVRGLNAEGKMTRMKARDDLLAQALEHEIDHINGTLYVDHLPSMDALRKIEPATESTDEETTAASRHD